MIFFLYFLRKIIVCTISASLVIQPIVAAEATLNHISINQIQHIQHQTDHPGQYALVLTPELWTLQDQQPVVLVDNQIPLGVIYKNQENLFFQAITPTGDQPIIPAHFHFLPDSSGTITHGALSFLSEGRLSLYQGLYGGTTKVQAKNIYVKKRKEATQPATVRGALLLNGSKRVQNTSPLSIKGHFLALAPTFHNKNQIKVKGKGCIQTEMGDNNGPIQFSQDSVITGYGENTTFKHFTNHNKIASKTKLTLNGQHFKQDRKSACFAGLVQRASLDIFQFQGSFLAPLLFLNAQKMLFQGGSIQAYTLYLKTQSWMGRDSPSLKARNGIYVQSQTMQGNGNFEIGGKASAFPYEQFYEDASRNGKRAHKLQKATEHYFRTHSQEIPSLEGCHLNCTILDLDQKSNFNVLSGPCTYQGSYALVRGQINMGPFNQQLMSFINERDLAIPGTLTGFQAEISSHRADLSGDFNVNNLKLQTEKTILSGIFEGEILHSLGRLFQIAPTGSMSYNQTIVNHNQINIDGIFKGQNLETHGQSFTISEKGSVATGHANLDNQRTVIAGQLSAGTVTVAGNLVEVSGTLNACQVTNDAPSWIVGGKADIRNFTSATSSLYLSGHKFKIRNAMIESLDIYFRDIGIDILTLKGHSLCLAGMVMGHNWNLNLAHQFKHSDLTLSSLNLTTPTWSQNAGSKMTVGQATVQTGSAHLPGTNTIGTFNFQGDTLQLSGPTVGNHWNLNLAHQFNHGDLNLSSLNLTTHTWSQNSASKMNLGQATVQTYYAYLPGNNTIGTFNFQGNSLTLSEPTKGYNWNLNLTHQFSHGDLSLTSLSLKAPYWTQTSGTTLQTAQTNAQVGTADLYGITKGGTFQGFIDHLNLRGGIESSQVRLQGSHFNNHGWINNEGNIGLDYNTYVLGNLNTLGTLALSLNDRHIDGRLLKGFENKFGYKMLSLCTNQHLTFTESLELHRSLALSAPSISFESKTIQETRKIGKGFFRFSVPTWYTPIQNFIVHGDLHLESRDHPLSISHYNLWSHKGIYQSGSHFILNGSTVAGNDQLLFDVKGNTVLNRTTRPSLLSAGLEGMQGNINGKFINNVSDLFSGGVLEIFARQGFEFNALEIHHEESDTRRTHWGLGKKTTTRAWNEVLSPTLTALGAVTLISPEGGANFDSTKIISPENITVATKGPVTNRERITYDHTVTKKSTPWSRKRTETKDQGDSPTVVASMEGVNITSWNDDINLPSTVIMAPRVLLDAEKNVNLTVPTLKKEIYHESRGWSISHALSGVSDNPFRPLMNLDSVTGSLMSLYDARSQHPVNQISAGMMAGINGYNTYKGYQNYQNALGKDANLSSFAMSRLLSSLCTVQFGYHDTEVSSYETSPGQGGIFSQDATIKSRKGNIYTLNGVPLDVEKLTISCPNGSWFKQGFAREFGGSSENLNMGMGFNLWTMTPTDISMAASSSDYEGIHWIPKLIRDQNPTIEAKSVVNLDGVDSFHQSQSSFGFSVGANSFSANINGYGFSYAASPGEGMLGSFCIQAKGMSFVVPIMGADSKPQPIPSQPKKVEEKRTLTAKESSRVNLPPSISSESPRKKELSRPKIPVVYYSDRISDREEHMLFSNTWLDGGINDTWRDDQPISATEEDKNYLIAALTGAKNGLVDLGESLWQLTKDVTFLYAGATEQARMREIAPWLNDEDIPSVTDTVPYKQAKKNMGERIETVKSIAELARDGAVLFTAALREAHMLEIAPWLEDQKVHNSFLSVPLYQQSDHNMTERFEALSDGYNHFSNQSTSYQIEKIFEIATPIFAPWGVLKVAKGVNYRHLPVNISGNKSSSFHRELTWSDFGVKKSPLHFEGGDNALSNLNFELPKGAHILEGTVTLTNKELHVFVGYVHSHGNNVREIMSNLMKTAQMSGAEKLVIKGDIINFKLQKMLETRYGAKTQFLSTVMEFPIKKGTADPTRLLLPAPNFISNAGGNVSMFATSKDKIFYRVYSTNPKGRFLTAVPPSSKRFAELGLALPPENSATFIQEVFVPKGVFVQRSRALPAFNRPGGAEQFQILNGTDLERVFFGSGRKLD